MSKHLKHLSLIVLAAFVLRFASFWLTGEYVINPDGAFYMTLARNLAAGDFRGFFDPYWSPLFPFVLSFFVPFSDSPELPGIAASLIFNSLLPIPVFLLAKQHYGIREAYLSAWIAVTFQYFLNSSAFVVSESIYYSLIPLVLFFGWQALKENKPHKFFLVGLLLCLSYLTRPEGFVYFLWFFVLILLKLFFDSEAKQTIKNIVFLVLGFFLLTFPFLIYLRDATEVWTLSGKFTRHFGGGNMYDPQVLKRYNYPSIIFVKTIIFNLDKEHKSLIYLFPPLLMIIAAVGLFRQKWESERIQKELYFLSFFIVTLACYAATVVEIRYLAVVLPVLFVWLAKGFYDWRDWLFETLRNFNSNGLSIVKNNFFYGLICVGLIFVYLLPTAYFIESKNDLHEVYKFEMKEAGLWLKQNALPDSSILSNSYLPVYYAQGKFVQLTDEKTLNQIQSGKADYLIIFERDFSSSEEFRRLNEKLLQSNLVEIIFRTENVNKYNAIVYRIRKNE